ncbi:MAG TPA: MSMEG_1061 family FMN-dependent PPOX-type flavoprotein [Gaiellales bacterium]|nr:MSMEG_1061 family FMN-dependent PPOX-type flavoprotein [Gaiellales bacterium]
MLDAGAHAISSPAQLRELFGEPLPRVVAKEMPALDEATTEFVGASPFLVMATTGADGSCDAGPKGGPPGFVRVLSDTRLLIPEFPGNRRFDGVQNLVERPGIGLLFVVPGISETLRVNGFAHLTREPELLADCAVDGRVPWFVADVEVRQVFSHCGKAFVRSHLWKPEQWPDADAVRSPSKSIAGSAADERRREADVRREVEQTYVPAVLYGEPVRKEHE